MQVQKWNNEINSWNEIRRDLYSYDQEGILTKKVTQRWDKKTQDWVRVMTFSYDPDEVGTQIVTAEE